MSLGAILIVLFASLVEVIAASYAEALHPVPMEPEGSAWATDLSTQYVDLSDTEARCIKTGAGSNHLILHSLRMQLEKMVPELAKDFTVCAYDCPGHGWRLIGDRRGWEDVGGFARLT